MQAAPWAVAKVLVLLIAMVVVRICLNMLAC